MKIEPNPTLVGQNIKHIRTNILGLSMAKFAEQIDNKAKSGTVANWETGKNLPNNERLKRIAELGGKTIESLLYGNSMYFLTNNLDKIMDDLPLALKRENVDNEVIVRSSHEIDSNKISLFDENAINEIVLKNINKQIDYYSSQIKLMHQIIKDNESLSRKIFDSTFLEIIKDEKNLDFNTFDEFIQLIESDDINTTIEIIDNVQSFVQLVENFLGANGLLFTVERKVQVTSLSNFLNSKNRELKKKFINFPIRVTEHTPDENATIIGLYDDETPIYICEYYKNRFDMLVDNTTYVVVIDNHIHTCVAKSNMFTINNNNIKLEEVSYCSPLLGIIQ